MSGEKELEAELVAVENNIKGIERAIEKLSDKKQKLLSRKQQIRQRIQEYASEKLAGQDWERCDHPWSAKVDKTLKCVFKMNTFRPHQLSTINAVMSQQDCILLMPTGGGKSLCYQLPAMVLPGITLVVSPLVSLMEDQIMAMEALKVPAALLNASSTREHVNYVQRQMTEKDPSLKLLYVTPEKLAKSKRFMSKLEKMYKMGQFSLLAIDEVHCCSQWGHDFRPDYKFLGIMKRQFPNVPILGLTATATSSVIADLQNILNIQGCLVLKASFNRPNLKYEVVCKSSCQKDNVDELEKMLKNRFNGLTGIIYCFSIKDSEDIAAELRKRSIRSRAYHAQLDAKSRSAVHHSWSSNEIQVIVATVAFGMGIDKPDVRFVIHHSMPKSMENFYQESGRAGIAILLHSVCMGHTRHSIAPYTCTKILGRDDNPASCILFYRFPDIFRQSTMIFTEQKGLEHLYAMVSYCLNLSRCRRAVIAEHFGERWEKSDCNNMCDHCDNYSPYAEKMKNVVDCHKTLCQILEHCNRIDERLTSQKLIDTWLCKGPAKLRPPGHKSASLSRETCERIVALLLLDSYLIEEFHFTPYSTISYINIGPRNLPSNGELILPLPVLKTKLQSKHFVDSESKSSATSGKSSSKISCPSKSSPKVSCPGNSSPKVSSPGKSSPKVSRPPEKKKQKLSSEIEVRKNSQQKSSSKSNHSSPKQSNKASSSSSKDPQLCVVNKEKSFFHNVVAIETDDYKTTDKIARDQIEEPDPIEISDDDIDFGSYDELKYHKRKKNVPMVVVSDSE